MSRATAEPSSSVPRTELRRSITGRLLFFYVLGDVLGSGIDVLFGLVADAVGGGRPDAGGALSYREEALAATDIVATAFQDWGVGTVHRRVLSGSPAAEIVKVAGEVGADLIVVASGSRGLTETVLLGSTASAPALGALPGAGVAPPTVTRLRPWRASRGTAR